MQYNTYSLGEREREGHAVNRAILRYSGAKSRFHCGFTTREEREREDSIMIISQFAVYPHCSLFLCVYTFFSFNRRRLFYKLYLYERERRIHYAIVSELKSLCAVMTRLIIEGQILMNLYRHYETLLIEWLYY